MTPYKAAKYVLNRTNDKINKSWVGVLGCLMCYIGILFNKFINYLANKWFNE